MLRVERLSSQLFMDRYTRSENNIIILVASRMQYPRDTVRKKFSCSFLALTLYSIEVDDWWLDVELRDGTALSERIRWRGRSTRDEEKQNTPPQLSLNIQPSRP